MAKRDYKITKGGLKVWEHPKGSGIKIRERRNPDGAIGYRVSLPTKLTGQHAVIIKQRKTLALAQGFAEQEFVKYSNLGKRAHTMTDAERVQAVEAIKLLNGRNTTVDAVVREYVEATDRLTSLGLSLAECVDFAAARLWPEGGDRTFNKSPTSYCRSKSIANSGSAPLPTFGRARKRWLNDSVLILFATSQPENFKVGSPV